MGETKTKPGEEVFGLSQEEIIKGLRGLVEHAEKSRAMAWKQLEPLQAKADALDNLRAAMKAIEELE